jgi:hypothetical protein
MQTDTPFTNWDTTGDIWIFEEGHYPRLWFEPEPVEPPAVEKNSITFFGLS